METKEMNAIGLDDSRYETLKADVSTIEPQGVLCQSNGIFSLGEETISDLF